MMGVMISRWTMEKTSAVGVLELIGRPWIRTELEIAKD
jgi:hypothetical protein